MFNNLINLISLSLFIVVEKNSTPKQRQLQMVLNISIKSKCISFRQIQYNCQKKTIVRNWWLHANNSKDCISSFIGIECYLCFSFANEYKMQMSYLVFHSFIKFLSYKYTAVDWFQNKMDKFLATFTKRVRERLLRERRWWFRNGLDWISNAIGKPQRGRWKILKIPEHVTINEIKAASAWKRIFSFR